MANARGQLHPRAVPLYNLLHRPIAPVALTAAAVALDTTLLVGALARERLAPGADLDAAWARGLTAFGAL
jgi:hypothetical protein